MERLTFPIRVTPRAGRDRVDGVVDGVLRLRVAAAPAGGAATAAALRLLATELGLPRSAVILAAGATSRLKRVTVEGIAAPALVARWPGLAV